MLKVENGENKEQQSKYIDLFPFGTELLRNLKKKYVQYVYVIIVWHGCIAS